MKTLSKSFRCVKAVLFDAGNTLLFFNLKEVQRALKESGYTLSIEKIRYAEAKAKEKVDELVLTNSDILNDKHRAILYYKTLLSRMDGISEKHKIKIAKHLRKKDRKEGLWTVAARGSKKVLSILKKRNFALGVISNSDGRVGRLLDEAGFSRHFKVIVDSAKFGVEKPHPDIFLHAAKQLRVKPEECVYIGDFYSIDVLGARRVKMKAVLLQPHPYYQHPPCTTIKSLTELLSLLPSAGAHKT